ADACFDLGQRLPESAVRVHAQAVALQLLARGEGDRAIYSEAMAVLRQHDVGVAAAVEVFADAGENIVGDARHQRLPDSDVFAGNLDLHIVINAPGARWCQAAL